MKFDWNDISIIPESLSSISSRKEVNPTWDGKLPLFTAPMDKVIDETNTNYFEENNINICLPRNVRYDNFKNDNYFYSYGLDEIIELLNKKAILPKRVLIDVANGHMQKLYDTAKLIKESYGEKIELMVGNIANPDTYRKYCEIGVDYIRVGIGGGSACTTSANVSIHYPMASLINECAYFKGAFENPTKIVADGGFRNFSDIIKALALGADYVMVGSIFNKAIESCGDNYLFGKIKVSQEFAELAYRYKLPVYKKFRGMSTKEVQKKWGKQKLTTSEGIVKLNKVEYTLGSWTENFMDYLKSAMSYTNSKNLEEFKESEFIFITQNALNRYHK